MCAICGRSTACGAEAERDRDQRCPRGCPALEDAFQCDCGDWYAKSEAKALGHSGELLCSWCAPELGFCEYDHAEYEEARRAGYAPDALDRLYAAFKDAHTQPLRD